jgi:hypothetical protein
VATAIFPCGQGENDGLTFKAWKESGFTMPTDIDARHHSRIMSSDTDRFFSVLFHLLRNLHESLGSVAPVILGCLLLASILLCVLLLRWLLRGGLSRSSRHLFAERREIERYLKDR